MNELRRRMSADDGLSLIEIVVAMVIFALMITGTLYAMLTVLQTTRDSRAQQVAANLAAQDIDLARDYNDLFKLLPTTYTVPLNGDTFTVTRRTEWVNGSGNDVKCGSGGAALSYKRVNVSVTWGNMRAGATAVRADTVIDPKSRITDPTKGTILVFVRTDGGVGSPDVVVTATASSVPNGAVSPSPNTATTDASGCAYILKVQPGNYDISLSHPSGNYVDENQAAAPLKTLGVQANATASVGFQYDLGGYIQVSYASNYVNANRPQVAANMETSFSNTYGSSHLARATGDKFLLHPFLSGYQLLAGDDDDCLANDPQAWTASGSAPAPPASPTVTAPAGTTKPGPVPMGVIQVVKTSNSGGPKYIRAVSVNNAGSGNPGCATTQVLRWTGKIFPSSAGSVTIALPYGSWRIFLDDNANETNTDVSNQVGFTGNSTLNQLTNNGGSSFLGIVTNIDPRMP